VRKFVSLVLVLVAMMTVLVAVPAMAQEAGMTGATGSGQGLLLAQSEGMLGSGAFGCGLVVIGGAYGIGRLAGSALESMARQPEVANNIQTAMIIAAALIEGFTFFALYICMTQNPFSP
jgi:F-type H+-transporting ATPase subunit c